MKADIGFKNGRTFRAEIDEQKAEVLSGRKIGDEISGDIFGLDGYALTITGGSDNDGFPMRKGIKTSQKKRILLSGGTGSGKLTYGVRVKKSVRGEIVSEKIALLNLKVIKEGKKKISEIFPPKTEEKQENTKEQNEQKEVEVAAEA